MNTANGRLARRLGLVDATAIGLGSMLGAGVFAAFAPAAAAAGSGLLLALVLAAFVAYCNASASAQLAAVYPASGGTYVYGRERLGEWWGFTAGWGFVVGKTASCAAMALTFAAYAAPGWERPAAVLAVVALTVVNLLGVTRTATVTKILLAIVLVVLIAVIVVSTVDGEPARLGEPWFDGGVLGVLQAAGLLFFAFAGYARIATLGEEVRRPGRTIPLAILGALAVAVVIYLLVGIALLMALGPQRLAATGAPLAEALASAGVPGWPARVGAAAASLGALLALIAGVGRTTFAMAGNRDLPTVLDAVHPRLKVPHRAEIAVGVLVCVIVSTVDIRGAIGFSSFGVLVYYAIANAAAYTQPPAVRKWPRALNVAGLAGCVLLAATLPWQSVLAGLAVFAVGLAGRAIVLRTRR
ncbi:amino acid/polyamine/organocation transporter (APC superfamily) [Herbihabitans rhizosphaerae]|uniref:Amino acid/polyamine/organocation transporter (APC superfamily) n=1 Tax=Herbihabitans rhizosphaerae TaxID=1872711 RepID=A0A4Q7KQF6_9PSEU|nr:amino acid permease [Herbihabitans rhizosphaerae]RZS37542.1 amino acid/polyamine/organocation transporter (APC superfamily) [Herbihabitans rhizosphaerae]